MLYLIREKPPEGREDLEWYSFEADTLEEALDEYNTDNAANSDSVFQVVEVIAPEEFRIGYIPVATYERPKGKKK